jgi:hypothetical protein
LKKKTCINTNPIKYISFTSFRLNLNTDMPSSLDWLLNTDFITIIGPVSLVIHVINRCYIAQIQIQVPGLLTSYVRHGWLLWFDFARRMSEMFIPLNLCGHYIYHPIYHATMLCSARICFVSFVKQYSIRRLHGDGTKKRAKSRPSEHY